ncbi:hypothetical protein [Deinococcus sp.]|uniref:hypothetical protein n=1 Tax=Deinococcus sp. TaxID=47478 RepID=UPI003C7C5B93
MQLASVWSDLYDSTLALYTGSAGGHRWLVTLDPDMAPEQAWATARSLEVLEGKGQVVLLAYAGLTPLEAALREQSNLVLGRGLAGVLVLDRELGGGPAMSLPKTEVRIPGGLTYREGGAYPAWTDALGGIGTLGECPPASVCAALGVPVRVAAPERLRETLLEWWAATPHALAAD